MNVQNIGYQLNEFSTKIFSNNKAERQAARQGLLQITQNFTQEVNLPSTELYNLPQWCWVASWIAKAKSENSFPYAIHATKAAAVAKVIPVNRPNVILNDQPNDPNAPGYIVTMPHCPKLSEQNPIGWLQRQIDLLCSEGFGRNAEESRIEARKRLRVMVGVNYCNTLNPGINRAYKNYIASLGQIGENTVTFSAFSWEPVWVEVGRKTVPQKTVKRFFKLILQMDANIAQRIFENVMKDKEVPFQSIREEIKNNPCVVSHAKALRRGHAARPCFLVSWDDDAIALRTEELGVFSHYDDLCRLHPQLQVATTGYYMQNPRKMFVELATRVDLVGRIAIAHLLPNGAYPPEPNMIIKIGFNTEESIRHSISFLRKAGEYGKNLESIGLLENLSLMKGDAVGRVVFGKKGPIITSEPLRASVPQHVPNTLLAPHFQKEKILASLRGFCQSSINPKYGFAANVCRTLPVGFNTFKVQAQIAHLFTSFDPVEYCKYLDHWDALHEGVIAALLDMYEQKLHNADYRPNYTVRAKNILAAADLPVTKEDELRNALEAFFETIWSSRESLLGDKIKLSEANFTKIMQTAVNVGVAVRCFLKSRINRTPFVFPLL